MLYVLLSIMWMVFRIILSSCSAVEASGVQKRNTYVERKKTGWTTKALILGFTVKNHQGGFLGIEVKEMGLNRYLLCLLLDLLCYSITGEVGSFGDDRMC